MSRISFHLGTFKREGQMQKYYIFLNLRPAAGPAQANTTVLQLPIIETRAEVSLGLARADVRSFSRIGQTCLHYKKVTVGYNCLDSVEPALVALCESSCS